MYDGSISNSFPRTEDSFLKKSGEKKTRRKIHIHTISIKLILNKCIKDNGTHRHIVLLKRYYLIFDENILIILYKL